MEDNFYPFLINSFYGLVVDQIVSYPKGTGKIISKFCDRASKIPGNSSLGAHIPLKMLAFQIPPFPLNFLTALHKVDN